MHTLPLHDATITDKNDQRYRPSNLYTEPEKFNEVTTIVDSGVGIFVADVKHVLDIHGQPLILNVPRNNYDLLPGEDVIVAALHYLTSEEAKGFGTLHNSMAKRGDGTILRCNTWEWVRVGVGDDVYNKCVHLDIIPFAFPYDTLPTDLVSVADYELIMNSWFTNVINPIMNHPRCSIAFLSKATAEVYAEHSPIGSTKKLKADFKKNPRTYISASNDEMVAGYHPECCSKKKFRSNMELKLSTNDALYTEIIHRVTGELIRVCTFNMAYFDENSATFKLCQRIYIEGCRLGGRIGGRIVGDRVIQAFALYKAKMFHLMSDAHWHIYDCKMLGIDSLRIVDCSKLADDLTNAKSDASEEDRAAILLETVTLIRIAKDGRVRKASDQHRMLDRMAAQDELAASDVDEIRSQLDPISTRQNRRGHLDDIVVSIEGELRRLSDLVGFTPQETKMYGMKYQSSAKIERKLYGLGMYVLASDAALVYDTFCKRAYGDECRTNYANAQDHMRYRNAELKRRGLVVDFGKVQALITKKVEEALSKLNSVQQVPSSPKKLTTRKRKSADSAMTRAEFNVLEQMVKNLQVQMDDLKALVGASDTSSSMRSEDDESRIWVKVKGKHRICFSLRSSIP